MKTIDYAKPIYLTMLPKMKMKDAIKFQVIIND